MQRQRHLGRLQPRRRRSDLVALGLQSDIGITKFVLLTNFNKGCVFPPIMLSGEMTATPDNTSAISSLSISGTLKGFGFESTMTGKLEANEPGTFGIE
jgi:hypothetical protein